MTMVVAVFISRVDEMISHDMHVVWPTNFSLSSLLEISDL